MSISSSVVLVLAVVAAVLAVLRLVEMRELLDGNRSLRLTDQGSRTVMAFATHYFFSVFVLCVAGTTTESSLLFAGAGDASARRTQLFCFGILALLTLVFFM